MALNVGLNVQEVDGRTSPAIQAAPTSIAGFIGTAERGVINRPLRVTDPGQFRAAFGGFRSDSYLAYSVQGFFLNGGREAIINRVTGAGTTAAAANLSDRQTVPEATLRVRAGQRGIEDPGRWGERLRIDVRDDPRALTTLQASTALNATSADLTSVAGLRTGSVIRFVDGVNEFYRKITGIAGPTISWTAPIAPVLNAGSTQVTSAEFSLTVQYQASADGAFEAVELWRSLSMETDSSDYAPQRVNHSITGSLYITVSDLSGATASGVENPAVATGVALGPAVENAPATTDYTGQPDLKTGIFAFDTAQIQLLAAPDAHFLGGDGPSIAARAAADYCALRNDCMYVGSAPDRGHSGVAIARARSAYNQTESSYLTTVRTYSGRRRTCDAGFPGQRFRRRLCADHTC